MPTATAPRLVDALPTTKEVDSSIAELLQALYERRFTGPLTLHFVAGIPKVAVPPAPQIRLTS